MSAYVLPLLATVVAFALTYVFCIRPMRTGRACHTAVIDRPRVADTEIDLREEVRRLRREVETSTRPAESAREASR